MEMHPKDGQREHVLTMANEDYLECIYRIILKQDGDDEVRSVDIAECMNVSKASVSKAINTLKDEGFVEQSRYGKVALTERGHYYAKGLWRCHQTLRVFLIKELGVDPEVADHEACQMEHAISRDTITRWADFLEKNGLDLND